VKVVGALEGDFCEGGGICEEGGFALSCNSINDCSLQGGIIEEQRQNSLLADGDDLDAGGEGVDVTALEIAIFSGNNAAFHCDKTAMIACAQIVHACG